MKSSAARALARDRHGQQRLEHQRVAAAVEDPLREQLAQVGAHLVRPQVLGGELGDPHLVAPAALEDRVVDERLGREDRRRARLGRAPAEVGVLARGRRVALVEAVQPLEQRARVEDVAGLEVRGQLGQPQRLGERARGCRPPSGRAASGPGRSGPRRRRGPSAGSRATSASGRQSSSVNATSGAVAARQPRLRALAGPPAGRGGTSSAAGRRARRRPRAPRRLVARAVVDDDDLERSVPMVWPAARPAAARGDRRDCASRRRPRRSDSPLMGR